MTVSDVMSREVQCVRPGVSVTEAKDLMRRKRIHHLVVKDGANLLGVVSARDLNRRVPGRSRDGRTVADTMSRHVLFIERDATVGRASHKMRGHSVGCLIVLEHGLVVGIVTASDLLGLLHESGARLAGGTKPAMHHRVAHRHRGRGDGTW